MPLQPNDNSLKFVLPDSAAPGVFAVQVVQGAETSIPCLLNRPDLWFCQPASLRPGLGRGDLPPGAEIQIIGKNFTFRGDANPHPLVALRPKFGGVAVPVPVLKAEPFSLSARLPDGLAAGEYEMYAHPGTSGPSAWSEPLTVRIKSPEAWPDKVFNVRQFGAKGNDVTDDTNAIRDAMQAAEKNGGGIVFFPWGTYRLSDYLPVPARTILRGELRDASVLKWPLDPPKDDKDFQRAAVFIGPDCGLENLTLTARRVETILLDVQCELDQPKTVPPEATSRIRPFGSGGNIFLRHLLVQHLLLAGRPEQQKPAIENPALNKRYWQGMQNAKIQDGRNCEISDCTFEGGDELFTNMVNARIVRNSFANHMGYSWANFGGGAIDVVCQDNDIQASSSWGWGWSGMQHVYSAHNSTLNFVRGEREAMTLDISALPTARPASQYWGTPAEAGVRDGKPFVRFPPGDVQSPDGFRTGWTPGCFRGGTLNIRAFSGGAGGGQSRTILDNDADTVFLDKPFSTPPETTQRKLYIELAPRHARAHIGTTAWLGKLAESKPQELTVSDAKWVPLEFVGMTALILDGRGAGQYRTITANSENRAMLDRPWDVVPDQTSLVGIWSLMRHMIVYDCRCSDASAFAQLYGSFYDYIVDSCKVERTQGMWGQMGWFVQFRDNHVSFAQSYHPGIGMHGPNPEGNSPFGYNGLDGSRLRITKSAAFQYPDRKLPIFADDVIGKPVPSILGHIQRGNTLEYGQRIVVQPWAGDSPPGQRPGDMLFRDIIIDRNTIEHSSIGIQLGPNVGRAVLSRNVFSDVARPIWTTRPGGAVEQDNVVALPK